MRSLLLLCIAVSCGCGSDQVQTYPVSGRVQFADGEPVRTGTIELESVTYGTTAAGTIQADGTFVLGTYAPDDGAAAGDHRAIVVQIIVADGITTHTKDHGRAVSPLYRDYESSPLRVEVLVAEKNEFVITLEDETASN